MLKLGVNIDHVATLRQARYPSARLAAGMRRATVPLHRIDTSADLATALIEVVASTRRRRA